MSKKPRYKRTGTHVWMRGSEVAVKELITRLFGAEVEPGRLSDVSMGDGDVVFFDERFAILLRRGCVWNAVEHSLENPSIDEVKSLGVEIFGPQAKLIDGWNHAPSLRPGIL